MEKCKHVNQIFGLQLEMLHGKVEILELKQDYLANYAILE